VIDEPLAATGVMRPPLSEQGVAFLAPSTSPAASPAASPAVDSPKNGATEFLEWFGDLVRA